jgi:hypothetical protein
MKTTANPFGICTLVGAIAGTISAYALIYLSKTYPMLALLIVMVVALIAMGVTFKVHWRFSECIQNALLAEKLGDLYSNGNDFYGETSYDSLGDPLDPRDEV